MAARKKGEEAFKSNYARLKADEVRMPTRIANALSNAGLRTLCVRESSARGPFQRSTEHSG